MALKTNINFVSQSRDGRMVVVKDSTGLESLGVATGYGATNGIPESILAHYFVVSRIASNEEYILKIDGTNNNLPDSVELANGAPLALTPQLFENGEYDCSEIFSDGVINLDMYVEFLGLGGVNIEEGSSVATLVGPGTFDGVLKGDAIMVNEYIYQIDKSKDDQGGTLLFITGEFETDGDSLTILYRTNTKALLTRVSENIHDYAVKKMKNNIESREWFNINTALSFRVASEGFFNKDVPDYYEADDLIKNSLKLIKHFTI